MSAPTAPPNPPSAPAPPCAAPPLPDPIDVAGVPLHPVDFAQTVSILMALARGAKHAYAVTANVDHVVRVSRCPELRCLYTEADLTVADGMPLVWASRLLRTPLPERVAGSDLFPVLCERAAEEGLSVFLLGGAPGSADKASAILRQRHPKLAVAGVCCPDFGFEYDVAQSAAVLDQVSRARPDILFVGLGSPKQEKWIAQNRVAAGAKLSIGVGISFSFLAGDVTRAPVWMQRVGLEWAHRLWQEPRRLWKRYIVEDSAFIALVLRQVFGGKRSSRNETPS